MKSCGSNGVQEKAYFPAPAPRAAASSTACFTTLEIVKAIILSLRLAGRIGTLTCTYMYCAASHTVLL